MRIRPNVLFRVLTSLPSVLLAATLASPSPAQSWHVQYPPQLADAPDLEVLSGLNVWVATTDGTLRHTTDGGVNWSQPTVGAAQLRAVQFANGNLGWAAGDGIWRTADAGQTWTRTSTRAVRALVFVDASAGWALTDDARVVRTTDGGLTWSSPPPLPGSPVLDDVHALAGGLVWACGAGGALFSSVDSGITWSPRPTGTTADLTGVHFASQQRGWICAGSQVRTTTDGGASWTVQSNPSGQVLEDVTFLTDQRGWCVGRGGARIQTSNGGATWTTGTGGTSADLLATEFADFLRGYAVGVDGVVALTSDGGATWTQVAGGTPVAAPSVWGIDAVDAQHAWATTRDDAILRTTDGGDTWQPVPVGPNFQWNDVSFVDAQHGFACGEKQAYFPAMAWTSDGGLSWNSIYYGMMVRFHDVEALSPTTALVTGETFVFRTTDGGLTWPSVAPQPYGTYYGMDFVDASTGWIAGSQIFRTDDGGLTWTHQLTPASTVNDVGFATAQVGFCVGNGGTFLATSDGGASWTASVVPGATNLTAIAVVDAAELWIVGDQGFVARSVNGGASWSRVDAGLALGAQPYDAEFVSPTDGWVVGYTGMPIVARRGVACTPPVTYCTPKVNSQGNVCTLGSVGSPSWLGGGFSISYQGAIPNQFAVLTFSQTGAANIPFLGGTRCIANPIVRTGNFSTGSGSGTRPIAVPSELIGRQRWYQIFYRDPQSADGTGMGLSDGLEVLFCG